MRIYKHSYGRVRVRAKSAWRAQVEVAVLRALTARAPTAPAPQLEYLLQKVLMLLATMAQRAGAGRSPLQLRAAAATAYHALRTVAACEVIPACLFRVG